MVQLDVGKRDVADDRVDAALRELRVTEVLDADILAGVEGTGDAAGDQVQLDADETHAIGGLAHETAGATAGLQDQPVGGDTEAGDGLVNRGDGSGRGVEGVE